MRVHSHGGRPSQAQTRALHAYLRWRNANARHPDVLVAQRRERARVRSEKGIRWGGRPSLPQPDRQGNRAAPGDNEFRRCPGSSP